VATEGSEITRGGPGRGRPKRYVTERVEQAISLAHPPHPDEEMIVVLQLAAALSCWLKNDHHPLFGAMPGCACPRITAHGTLAPHTTHCGKLATAYPFAVR